MKLYKLEDELRNNFIETSETKIGIDNKYGECLISSISIKDLLHNYYYQKLLSKKVKEVFNTNGNNEYEYVFVLNSK